MVVDGAVVNRPSDRQGERAVGNALVVAGCR
jgi:exopolysaccharide biosynthesis protein